MRYMLDTNICIYVIQKASMAVLERLRKVGVPNVGVSSITLSELEYGVEKSLAKKRNRIALASFLGPLEIAPYDEVAARAYGSIRCGLERAGTPIGSLDVLIGAHALSLGLTLVTNNEREFRRIPGLKIENWAKNL